MKNKSIIWIIDGSLKDQLHQNARISPAIELSKLGWQVTMLTSKAPNGTKNGPIRFVEIAAPRLYFFGMFIYYIKVLRILFSKRVSKILFFHLDSITPILLSVPIWQALTGDARYDVVMDYRSLPMNTETIKGKLRGLVFFIGHRIGLKLNIDMTAISNRMVRALNLPGSKIAGVWPSGANIDAFRIAIETRSWPTANEPIRLVYVGAINAGRNLRSVVEAAITTKARGVNLTLDIIGSGNRKESLKRIAENRSDSFIKVWGPVPQAQVPELLAEFDIGILPFPDVPKMNVSSAIKMFEYMAAGMPVLATRIEAHTAVFKETDFVFWSGETAESLADAMAAASAAKARLPVLGQHAKEYAKSWSWAESAKKLSTALERVIAGRG